MITWLREHFNLNPWCANLDRAGGVSWLAFDTDWVIGRHYSVTVGLGGFCACLTYYPRGKYSSGDTSELMDGAYAVVPLSEFEAMEAKCAEFDKWRESQR